MTSHPSPDARTTFLARRAAARLAGDLDRHLPQLTERLIAENGAGHEDAPRMRSFDAGTTIALAGFLLSVAQFAWTIYRDLKSDREEAAEQATETLRQARTDLASLLARKIRIGIDLPSGVTPAQQGRLIEVVVEEIVQMDEDGSGTDWDRQSLR